MPATAVAATTAPESDYERQINEAVAEEVRAAMARKRINQTQLGRILGIGQSAISRRLSGEVPFDVVELHRVADATGMDLGLLLRIGSFSCLTPVPAALGQLDLLAEIEQSERPTLVSV